MARIRTIKPEFFRHEQLQDLESQHPQSYIMLVYAGLWTQCDMGGVFTWKPRHLKLDILPFLEYDIIKSLEILLEYKFVVKFTGDDGKEYGYIPSFLDNQHIPTKEKQQGYRYPAFDKATPIAHPMTHVEARPKARPQTPTIGAKEKEREKERNKKYIKKEPAINITFEEFWEHYDKKTGSPKKLISKWNALTDDERLKAMEHIKAYKIAQPDKQYRKNPETYLNNHSFNDEIIPTTKGVQNARPQSTTTNGTITRGGSIADMQAEFDKW